MTMGVVAIAGIYPFAGFFSKDEILYQVFVYHNNAPHKLLWAVGLLTAGMTSFYMFRLWFKTFFGEGRFEEHPSLETHGAAVHASATSTLTIEAEHGDDHGHSHGVHESPWVMLVPLLVLAVLSVVGGWVGVPAALGGHNEIEHFLDPVFGVGAGAVPEAVAETASYGLERGLAFVSVATALVGLFFAWLFYYKKPGTAAAMAEKAKPLYSLIANKFYVDEIYQAIFVTGLLACTRIFLYGLVDRIGIDGSGRFASWMALDLGEAARKMQSGNIRSYAGWLALGAAVVMTVMIFGRGIWVH
jgi:NADH-quinone oxidoreductase subunit L